MNKLPLVLLIFASVVFVTGCQTVESRIGRNPQVFAALDAATQQKVKQGVVEEGFTSDMVYLALGDPAQKHELVDAQGKYTSWIYSSEEVDSNRGRIISSDDPSYDSPRSIGSTISEGRFTDGRFTGNRSADYSMAQGSFAEREVVYQDNIQFRKSVREIVFTDGKVDLKREGYITQSWRKLVEKRTAEVKARMRSR